MIDFSIVRGWVFDLDDTLFLERDYVFSGFAAVDSWLTDRTGKTGFRDLAIQKFIEGVRGNTFDLCLEDMKIQPNPEIVSEMVAHYRQHLPSIALAPDAEKVLDALKGRPIGIISDGSLDSQSRKVNALGLSKRANPIVLTGKWQTQYGKPHERAFREVQVVWGFEGRDMIYIGDNPKKDFQAPRALGWQTICIRRPSGIHSLAPDQRSDCNMEISSFLDILNMV